MQFIVWLVFCFLVSLLARNRRPGPVAVFIISIFLTPLIGLAVALFAKKKPTPPELPIVESSTKDVSTSSDEQNVGISVEDVSDTGESANISLYDKHDQITNALFCDGCGHPLEADSAFCQHCGKSVE